MGKWGYVLEHPCRHQLRALLSHTSYNVDSKSCSALKQVSTAWAGGTHSDALV